MLYQPGMGSAKLPMRFPRPDSRLMKSVFLICCAALAMALLPSGSAAYQEQAGEDPVADYRLGARDVVRVTVLGVPELQDVRAELDADGVIRLPLLGEVTAAGLTVKGLEGEIRQGMVRFVNDPQVMVAIEQYQSQSYFIFGAVGSVGSFPITGRVTLLEALVAAGGILSEEATGTIQVVRRAFPQQPLEIDGNELFFKGNRAYDITLAPGDMVNVLTKPTYRIYVYGEGGTGGAYTFRDPVTVLQAITLIGGIPQGASKKIKILRTQEGGDRTTLEVNVRDIIEGKERDMLLRPDDVLVIAEGFLLP